MVKDLKVNKDCYIPLANIKFYSSYNLNATKTEVRKKRKENKVYDFTNGKKINTVVYLISDEIILLNTTIETIAERIEELS